MIHYRPIRRELYGFSIYRFRSYDITTEEWLSWMNPLFEIEGHLEKAQAIALSRYWYPSGDVSESFHFSTQVAVEKPEDLSPRSTSRVLDVRGELQQCSGSQQAIEGSESVDAEPVSVLAGGAL